MLRRSEWVIGAYLAYAGVLSLTLDVPPGVRRITVPLNSVVIGGFLILARAWSLRHNRLFDIMRDWYPVPLMLLAYREMGWFAPAQHSYRLEQSWEAWDKILFYQLGFKAAIESAGALLPNLLELSYLLVYAIPSFALAMLCAYRQRERADRFLFQFLLAILLCYTLFPLFPSEPPRTVFPGQDLPPLTALRRLNLWLLGGYGIHTSVFPSAHTAGAFSGAFAMFRLLSERRWVGRFLLVLAALIATATVYGRYHYAADAVAGFTASLIALVVARRCSR